MVKYYKTLGLEKGASNEEIEAAYTRLSKELDPANNDNLEFFEEEYALVQEAYKELTGNQLIEEKSVLLNDLFNEEDTIVTIMKRFRSSNTQDKFKILTFLEDNKVDSRFNQAINMIFKNEKIKSIGEFQLRNSINDDKPKKPNKNKNNTPKPKSSFLKKRYVIILLLIGSVGITYLLFQNKVNDFELNIPKIEANEVAMMDVEKDYWTKKLKKDYPRLKSYFKDSGNKEQGNLDFADAIVSKDTLIKLLFFSKQISFNGLDKEYFKCAYYHEINRYKNKYNKEYLSWFSKTRKRFGLGSKTMNNLINIVKQSSSKNSGFPFLNSINNIDIECKKCIPNYITASDLDDFSIKDFDGFIKDYFKNKRVIDNSNKDVQKEYNSKFNSLSRNMNTSLTVNLDTKLKNKPVLTQNKVDFTFSGGETLGVINYSFVKKKFNKERLEKISNDVFNDFYKTNSLTNGSTPYRYCYGINPYCSPPSGYKECSFIDIRASSTSDVIVIIKKNNVVYSHAYIKAGGYHKFKLGNGSFQTFFYYGSGWNPNKFMKNASCGKITGGFVNNESVDKSEVIFLNNSTMSYTLYSSVNGNFSPKQSNKNEAF